MSGQIDWEAIAHQLGFIRETETGRSEQGGGYVAQAALAEIIGETALRDAVDYYVSGQPGFETAKSVLQMLKPVCAMNRCHEIFLTSSDPDEISFAINLLQYVANESVLPRVSLYLASENDGAQYWGVGIVDQLVSFGGLDLEDAMPVLRIALAHHSAKVRERAQLVIDHVPS